MVSRGLPEAISIIALSAKETMHCPRQFVYMNKIVIGPDTKDYMDINALMAENLNNIARAKKRKVSELTVVVSDRSRHEQLISDISGAGVRVEFISDGDVPASIDAALPEREVNALMGVGGKPEGIFSVAAIHYIRSGIQCKA